MTRVYQEVPDVAGRQAVLRSALSNEWSILWSAGRLDIKTTDDIDAVVDKLFGQDNAAAGVGRGLQRPA